MPAIPPASSTAGTQRFGPSSIDAVMAMHSSMSSMSGVVRVAWNISLMETPERTPSVAGKRWPSNRTPYAAVGIRISAILICHDVIPALSSPKAASPPSTIPPGNHTWNWLSLTVLLSG